VSLSSSSGACFGWCEICGVEHRLQQGPATRYAQELMAELEESQRIDYIRAAADANPEHATDYLYGAARGQMFGVLVCEDRYGQVVVLRAFSGQYNGTWNAEGWVTPLFDVAAHDGIMIPADHEIKVLGQKIDANTTDSAEIADLRRTRKKLSQSVMKELHALYELHNFCGQSQPLTAFYKDANGIPTGAGDCCAPKLLDHAARHHLKPLGIAEFFWGATNRSGTCEQGHFYDSCIDRCQPILGFLLCGATT